MIIRIKKRKLIQFLIFLMIVIPLVYAATGPITREFMVYLKMANQDPYIHWVNQSAAIDPLDGDNVIIMLWFNASDPDGYADLAAGTANISVNDSSLEVNATQCWSVENGTGNDLWGMYNCSITMKYWYNATSWQINATIKDDSGVEAVNDTETFAYNELSAMQLLSTIVNFSSVNVGDTNVSAATNPFLLNNTGNDDFDVINITGSSLQGQNITTQTIGVGNISVNWSANTANGLLAMNDSNMTLTNAVLKHGEPPISNMSVDFYITVPDDAGLSVQNYNATKKWKVTVYDNP